MTEGIVVQKYCRFGNNISQLVNAIAVAKKYKLKWVNIKSLKYIFKVNPKFVSTKIDGVLVTMCNQKGHFMSGKFFYPSDYPDISGIDTASILNEIGDKILSFKDTCSFPGIHVHIRSGDIFDRKKPKSNYTQPPAAFYKKAILDYLPGRHPYVKIVYEDNKNPCVSELSSWLKNQNIKFKLISGSISNDVNELATAQVLIAGKGTFSQIIAGMTGAELVCFRSLSLSEAYFPKFAIYKDIDDSYISDSGWQIYNGKGDVQKQQLHQIINYPMEKIVKC